MSTAKKTLGLDRLLVPVGRSLNREAAEKLINLRADESVQKRVAELAEKCDQGTLTPEENAEYERYVTASSLIAALQAKARLRLAEGAS